MINYSQISMLLMLSIAIGCDTDTTSSRFADNTAKRHAKEAVHSFMTTQLKSIDDAPAIRAEIIGQLELADQHIENSKDGPLIPFPLYVSFQPSSDHLYIGAFWIEEGFQVTGFRVLAPNEQVIDLPHSVRWSDKDREWFEGTGIRDYYIRLEWSDEITTGAVFEGNDILTIQLPENLRNQELSLALIYDDKVSASATILSLTEGSAGSLSQNGQKNE